MGSGSSRGKSNYIFSLDSSEEIFSLKLGSDQMVDRTSERVFLASSSPELFGAESLEILRALSDGT